MNKILILIVLLLIINFTHAQCETSIENITRFDATYNILENGNAEVTFVIVANFPENCLIERYKLDLNLNENEEITIQIPYQDFICPKEFILNNIKAEFGNFPNGLDCSASFTNDRNHIRMNFNGTSSFLGERDGQKVIVSLGGSNFTNNLTRDSSITIFIPSRKEYLIHAPLTASKSANRLFFSPIPSEEIYFEYNFEETQQAQTREVDPLWIILIILGAITLLIFLFGLIIIRKPNNKKNTTDNPPSKQKSKVDIYEEGKKIKEKMSSLEKSYLKGGIDENTYQRLMEQYQYQLNEIRVELKKQDNK